MPDMQQFTVFAGCDGGYVNTFNANTSGVSVPVREETDIDECGNRVRLSTSLLIHSFIHLLLILSSDTDDR